MQKTIVLCPTAIGKSEYALKLAKQQNAEIVSVDSMQVYKYMDIGTAKLSPPEMQEIKHYMIDILFTITKQDMNYLKYSLCV